MHNRPSIKNTTLSLVLITHMFLETEKKTAHAISVVFKHLAQLAYDRLPWELYDIPRGKTLFSNIPIVPWTIGCSARIIDCLSKIVFRWEIFVHWSIMQNTVQKNIHQVLVEHELPNNGDIHTYAAMIAFLTWTLAYLVVKSNDVKIEMKRNKSSNLSNPHIHQSFNPWDSRE